MNENIGIKVEAPKVTKKAVKHLVNDLIALMVAGRLTKSEGKTVRHAMTIVGEHTHVHSVKGASVSNCNITMGNSCPDS